jgi:hypothetical protein
MPVKLRLFTLRHKVYWFWCLIFAAGYADWRRIPVNARRRSPRKCSAGFGPPAARKAG